MATEVAAHITGTIWKIEVKEGDKVTEGQTLVILESMKMEMPLEAPEDGVVEKIHVAEAQAVSEGDVLVTLA
jgi:acetyl-CoA carboxylase biotin carboxyl carrier protein